MILILLLVFSNPIFSDSLTLNLTSYHLNSNDKNEQNYGIGYENGPWRVGTFKNSHNVQSFYAGVGWEQRHGWFTYGVDAFLATGYGDIGYDVLPVIAPNVSFGTERVNVQVHSIGTVTSAQLRIGF